MPKLPEFTVICSSAGYGRSPDYSSPAKDYASAEGTSFYVHWKDDAARYHINLGLKGTIVEANDVIHKNVDPLPGERWSFRHHRGLALDTKANAPIVAAIIEAIADGELARAAFNARRDADLAKREEERKAYADKIRAAFNAATGDIERLCARIAEELSDESLIRLANIIRSA